MTGRTFMQTRRWMQHGTAVFLDAARLTDSELAEPSRLPGWTPKHVISHVAANADALGNLVSWAATGQPKPMYTSPAQRDAAIDHGVHLSGDELTAWLRRSAEALEAAMVALSDDQWREQVLTAQGRTVHATEVPWMRAREVCVHATDLASGVHLADLPTDFLLALCDDVVAKRSGGSGPALLLHASDVDARWQVSGAGQSVNVHGLLSEITDYLIGRANHVHTPDLAIAPPLPPWL